MVVKRKICVSIPLCDDNTNDKEPSLIIDRIEEATRLGADIIECRFDFLSNFNNIDSYLDLISASKDRCIYTLRPQNEGGNFSKNTEKRIEILKKFIVAKPLLVDIEYSLISENDDIADFVENQNTQILVSWHDFFNTPSLDHLLDLVKNMRIYSPFIKLVTTAKSIDDCIEILNLYQSIDTHVNLIAFAMGELGIMSRVLCTIVGDSPFTYASIGNAVAPGQLSILQMNSIYRLFKNKLV